MGRYWPTGAGLALDLMAAMPALAQEAVTVDNFKRAETHYYMKAKARQGCFGKLCHDREPIKIENQDIIRLNRDTPYSQGVFDQITPLSIEMPDTGDRFQSLMVINEDHYIKHVSYDPGTIVLTQDMIGSRYVYPGVRTFMDPKNPADMEEGEKAQDAIKVTQDDIGSLDFPEWNEEQRQGLHDALLLAGRYMPDSKRAFGDISEVDPVRHLVATSIGWAGNRMQDALYLTEEADADGMVTIHFGGDPAAANYLRIMPGWNYTVRLYRPRAELLDGSCVFPKPVAVN